MEADKFDQLMGEKLDQANAPKFSEKQWSALSSKLPASGFGLRGINSWVITMLLVTNALWAWNFMNNQKDSKGKTDKPGVTAQNEANNPDAACIPEEAYNTEYRNQTVVISDTIYNYVEVEKIVYVTVERQMTSIDQGLSKTDSDNPTSASETTSINDDQFLLTDEGQNGAATKIDSLALTEEKSVIVPDQEDDEKGKNERVSYSGPSWFLGINVQKPFSLEGDQTSFSAYGIGADLEYQPLTWFCLIAEINYLTQTYTIDDPELYATIVDQNDGGQYAPGGVYGSGYSWQNSEIGNASIQTGAFIKIMIPSLNEKILPFLASGYIFNIRQNTDLTNKLIESGTEKVILVESKYPYNRKHSYLRSELGLETQLNEKFSLRLSVDYWHQLTGPAYTGDMLGVKAVLVYILK